MKHIGLYVKYLLFLADFNLIFSTDFRKILKHEILLTGGFFYASEADRRKDRHDEANSHFSQSCERANNQSSQKYRHNIEVNITVKILNVQSVTENSEFHLFSIGCTGRYVFNPFKRRSSDCFI
jgi:hypothetical protein